MITRKQQLADRRRVETRLRSDHDMGKLLDYAEAHAILGEEVWLGSALESCLGLSRERLADLPEGLYARLLLALEFGIITTPELVFTSVTDAWKGKPCRLNSFRLEVYSYLPKH